MTEGAHAWDVAAARASQGSSFRVAMTLLPHARRTSMLALYAFCRAADDIVDGGYAETYARASLAALHEDLRAVYDGSPKFGVTRALVEPVRRHALPYDLFEEILAGMEMDLAGRMLRPSLETLEHYCYRVAGCVGLLVIGILGFRSPHVPACAVRQGHALQLTNILRDIGEDALRGRIYLPREALYASGINDCPPELLLAHPGLAQARALIVELAQAHYDAAAHMPKEWSLMCAHLMRHAYLRKFTTLRRSIPAVAVPA